MKLAIFRATFTSYYKAMNFDNLARVCFQTLWHFSVKVYLLPLSNIDLHLATNGRWPYTADAIPICG